HGHIQELKNRVDFLFFPISFEESVDDSTYFYCYYSNYAVPILKNIESLNVKSKLISPVVSFSSDYEKTCKAIYTSFPKKIKAQHTFYEVVTAYRQACEWFSDRHKKLRKLFNKHMSDCTDATVILLGRPYLTLDPVANQQIPHTFNQLGLNVFSSDMLPENISTNRATNHYLTFNHWNYGSQILQSAEYVAKSKYLFPVFVTAFKCSPDSFILTYFKDIMDTYKKPYLIVQLDDHTASEGLETRIESAVTTFTNHITAIPTQTMSVSKKYSFNKSMHNRTILIPNYDNISCKLISAAFKNAGYNSLLIEETEETIQESLKHNDGQCLPVNAIVQGAIHTIDKHNLDPDKTTLYINAFCNLSCNLPQYPVMMRKLIEGYGTKYSHIDVYSSPYEMTDMGIELIYNTYCSYLLGGLLRRMLCKIRPYEMYQGETDNIIEYATNKLYNTIVRGESKESIFTHIVQRLSRIPQIKSSEKRPKVAIFGDLYVRDNDVFNKSLIKILEEKGAEVVTTPYSATIRMVSIKSFKLLQEEKDYIPLLRNKFLLQFLSFFEKKYYEIANRIIQEPYPLFNESLIEKLQRYDVTPKHGGETAQNLMKIFHLKDHLPDIRLFVHVNPIFCCPALVSESIFKKVESDIGIPIVSITYDGTKTFQNDILDPYLYYFRNAS
ncbi:MAG: acyl-CoA dehydratase activase-related protein, partial [Bacteroidota bacterium]